MKYRTIVIDPPWTVKNNLKNLKYYRTGKKMPYKTMTKQEILAFPIDKFADDQCDLFLWTITSKLEFSFELLKEWGFRFIDFFTWNKEIGVPVNGVYRQCEYVLYGYKGKMGINKRGKFLRTIVTETRREHSRKPDKFYEMLKTNTQEPRIDIFARDRHRGFDAWGDEVAK